MHQEIRKNLEEYLKNSTVQIPAEFHEHLGECRDCASEVRELQQQSQLLRSLKSTVEVEPRAGFYARVMERIEAQQPFSVWSVFLERRFGFRLAVASGMLAALLGVYLVTSEPSGPETSGPAVTASATVDQASAFERDAVLVDLASYRQ